MDKSLKTDQLNPFIQATVQTFSAMLMMKIEPGRIRIMDTSYESYDVTGVIGFTGGATGNVSLSFPLSVAHGVVASFLGEETLTTDQITDAIGELANIVAGSAKENLARYKLTISLPMVIQGELSVAACLCDSMAVVVPFECPAGKFDLAVSFNSLT